MRTDSYPLAWGLFRAGRTFGAGDFLLTLLSKAGAPVLGRSGERTLAEEGDLGENPVFDGSSSAGNSCMEKSLATEFEVCGTHFFTLQKVGSNLAHLAIGKPNIRSTSNLDSLALPTHPTRETIKNCQLQTKDVG